MLCYAIVNLQGVCTSNIHKNSELSACSFFSAGLLVGQICHIIITEALSLTVLSGRTWSVSTRVFSV